MRIVNYDTAKIAKEKNFNEECFFFYLNGILYPNKNFINDRSKLPSTEYIYKNEIIEAPFQYYLQEWLREKHHINIIVKPYNLKEKTKYGYYFYNDLSDYYGEISGFETYEEALENGLKKAMKFIN